MAKFLEKTVDGRIRNEKGKKDGLWRWFYVHFIGRFTLKFTSKNNVRTDRILKLQQHIQSLAPRWSWRPFNGRLVANLFANDDQIRLAIIGISVIYPITAVSIRSSGLNLCEVASRLGHVRRTNNLWG